VPSSDRTRYLASTPRTGDLKSGDKFVPVSGHAIYAGRYKSWEFGGKRQMPITSIPFPSHSAIKSSSDGANSAEPVLQFTACHTSKKPQRSLTTCWIGLLRLSSSPKPYKFSIASNWPDPPERQFPSCWKLKSSADKHPWKWQVWIC